MKRILNESLQGCEFKSSKGVSACLGVCEREKQTEIQTQSSLPGSTHGEDTAVWLGGIPKGAPSRDPPHPLVLTSVKILSL